MNFAVLVDPRRADLDITAHGASFALQREAVWVGAFLSVIRQAVACSGMRGKPLAQLRAGVGEFVVIPNSKPGKGVPWRLLGIEGQGTDGAAKQRTRNLDERSSARSAAACSFPFALGALSWFLLPGPRVTQKRNEHSVKVRRSAAELCECKKRDQRFPRAGRVKS